MSRTAYSSVVLRSPYDRDIARLAVPALGTLVAEPLYVLADTAIVGRIGTDELAGLALATAVLLSVHSIAIFLTYGTTATVARLIGGEREADAAYQSGQGLWLSVLLGSATALLLLFTGEWFLRLFGGEGAPLDAAKTYLFISLAGLPFLLIGLAGAGAFTGRQDTRTPLLIAVAGAVANLIIELILVLGLGYGIGASALSTVIAQVGTGLVFAVAVLRWARQTGVSLKPDLPAIGRLMAGGRALILRSIALRSSFAIGTAVAAGIGVAELAAHQVATQIWGTLTLGLDALAIAGQALTGKWLGAGDAVRARAAARRMIELDVGIAALVGIVVFVVREPLAGLFSTDPAVVSATSFVLVWVAVSQPLNGYVFALDGILIGAGDLTYLGRAVALGAVIFAGMAVWIVRAEAGLGWLWAAITVLMAIRGITLWWRWRSGRWVILGT
ncbi:MAG: MATE family efflux transporter [Actinomycetota bacterium]